MYVCVGFLIQAFSVLHQSAKRRRKTETLKKKKKKKEEEGRRKKEEEEQRRCHRHGLLPGRTSCRAGRTRRSADPSMIPADLLPPP
jgi:hypothetical protein